MLQRVFTRALTLFCMMLGLTACSGDLSHRRQFFGMFEHFANGKFVNEETPANEKITNKKGLQFAGEMLPKRRCRLKSAFQDAGRRGAADLRALFNQC